MIYQNNEMKIPKVIHQIWSGIEEPLPPYFEMLGNTWKEFHPSWDYIFWDNEKINSFIRKYYPEYFDVYKDFQYNIQRWDAIRYLILYKLGGLYVDFDYECLKSHESLFDTKTCCFASEPGGNGSVLNNRKYFFNNALMACEPKHPFMKRIIDFVFQYKIEERKKNNFNKGLEVLITTGPIALNILYNDYEEKDLVYLIPSEYVSPISSEESRQILLTNEFNKELETKLKKAYSVHYFFSEWVVSEN